MPYVKKGFKPKLCAVCSIELMPKVGTQRFCCVACKRKEYREHGSESTERQYALISGNWNKYFNRLCTKAFRRDKLTTEDCIKLLEAQKHKCALTGVELTCILSKGVTHKTNASIDRINPKEPYSVNNVQLVCVAVNKFRVDLPVEEFIEWCRKVADHAVQKP